MDNIKAIFLLLTKLDVLSTAVLIISLISGILFQLELYSILISFVFYTSVMFVRIIIDNSLGFVMRTTVEKLTKEIKNG